MVVSAVLTTMTVTGDVPGAAWTPGRGLVKVYTENGPLVPSQGAAVSKSGSRSSAAARVSITGKVAPIRRRVNRPKGLRRENPSHWVIRGGVLAGSVRAILD
jgi:hypothetical protein